MLLLIRLKFNMLLIIRLGVENMLSIHYVKYFDIFHITRKDNHDGDPYIVNALRINLNEYRNIVKEKFNSFPFIFSYEFEMSYSKPTLSSKRLTSTKAMVFKSKQDAQSALDWINSVLLLNKFKLDKHV